MPGLFNRLALFLRRFTPNFLLVPAMGWFFRVRDAEGNLQMPRDLQAPETGNRPVRTRASGPTPKP